MAKQLFDMTVAEAKAAGRLAEYYALIGLGPTGQPIQTGGGSSITPGSNTGSTNYGMTNVPGTYPPATNPPATNTVVPSSTGHNPWGGDPSTSNYQYEDNPELESQSLTMEKGIETAGVKAGYFSSSFIKTLTSDPHVLAFYVNALTYGGYTTGDILNDMKRRELISKGDTNAINMPAVIDPEMERDTYQNTTADGQKSVKDAISYLPTGNLQAFLDPEILKYGNNMPPELFKTLVPILDDTSEEYKDAIDEIMSGYADTINARSQAVTEQEKTAAEYNYNQFKETIKRQYGIALDDNAAKAWKQLEGLKDTYNTRGIAGSGMENEAIDDMLQESRKGDTRLRQEKLTKEQQQQASVMQASGTPEQIQALIAEDIANGITDPTKQRAYLWGLVPSADIKDKFSIEHLKEQNPDLSDKEIQALHDSVLDENGNYRSSLYVKYYQGLSDKLTSDRTLAEETLQAKTKADEAKAYKDYDAKTAFLGQTAVGMDAGSGLTKLKVPAEVQKLIDMGIISADQVTQDKLSALKATNPEMFSVTPPADTSGNTQNPAIIKDKVVDTKNNQPANNTYSSGPVNGPVVNPNPVKPATGIDLSKFKDQVISQTPGTGSIKNSDGTIKWPALDMSMKTTTPSTIVKPVIKPPTTYISQTPGTGTTTAPKAPVYGPVTNPNPASGSSPYKVVSGDTLGAIAARNKTTVAALAKLNGITNPNLINVGQTIKFQ